MRIKSTYLFAASCLLSSSHAELLVYEPFDYAPANDERFGALVGRNGGIGFKGPWENEGKGNAFVYDQQGNPKDLYSGISGENLPAWDGIVDNLPTLGGYVGLSDWYRNGNGDVQNSNRPLAKSAGEMAAKNGGVLWLSAVWHFQDGGFFSSVGIALSDGGNFIERQRNFTKNANAIGVGNGKEIHDGGLDLNPTFWAKGNESAQTHGTDIKSKADNIVILKFQFGETDTVSAWYFPEDQEMTEEAFNTNAKSVTSSIDENTLTHLAFSCTRPANAVDEFRIGTTFQSVITGTMEPRQEVKVEKLSYDSKSDRYHVVLKTNPGEIYGLYSAEASAESPVCITPALEAAPDARQTSFGPFPNPHPGKRNLEIRIGLPDPEPPVVTRAWGNNSTINIRFSEPMMKTPATLIGNHDVLKDGKEKIEIQSAALTAETLVLTPAKPLDANANYTLRFHNLTDLASRPLDPETTAGFRTWDNNPDGVKVFILAGQSNMVGRGKVEGPVGTLRQMVEKNPETYGHLLDENKNWKEFDSIKVWWNRADLGQPPRIIKGNFKPAYGAGPDAIAPEYGIGMRLSQYYQQPVLLIKAAWGGKSLYTDFQSPSAVERRGGKIGPYYFQMMDQVRQVLENLDAEFPDWKGKGYQIAGFGWHQGWNDNMEPKTIEAYEANMVDFIRDIRHEFGQPKLPFTIGATGHGGEQAKGVIFAQIAVADPAKHPEFAGNVFCADTRPFWRDGSVSPTNDGSHWNANGESYFLIGDAMGKGLVDMLKNTK